MTNTVLPSAIHSEIESIRAELHSCLDTDTPIDPKKVKRLCELCELRLAELAGTHASRLETMKEKTRECTRKMPGLSSETMKLNPAAMDKIFAEQDRCDTAATHWVIAESCPWEESQAASICAGILILAHEIC